MKQLFLLLFLTFCFSVLHSQNNSSLKIGIDDGESHRIISCKEIFLLHDCSKTKALKAEGEVVFSCLPRGRGELIEFSNNPIGNLYYFEQEHNSIWLKFKIVRDGDFAFKITPNDGSSDLDFLLYKKFDDNFCMDIITKKIKPIRTNLSRPDSFSIASTGLSLRSKDIFIGAGKGNPYCKSIKVKKGEEFILVIDKVSKYSFESEDGFALQFQYFDYTLLSGTLIDNETADPLVASISWEDKETGEVLSSVTSNSFGYFEMKVPYELGRPSASYLLNTEMKGYFYLEKNISSKAVKKLSIKPLVLLMPRLKKGIFSRIKSINFYSGEDQIMPHSKSSLNRLKKLMLKNPLLTIRIDGHTNGCNPTVEEMQILSDSRSVAIKKYLVEHDINENRIYTKGYNCSKMLYSEPETEDEETSNRRVEILVLDF